MKELFFKLDRTGLEGIDEKKDREVCLDWFRAAFASSAAQSDPFMHILWESVLCKCQEANDISVNLTQAEFVMLKLALIRANFNAAGNNLYVQLLKKFEVFL